MQDVENRFGVWQYFMLVLSLVALALLAVHVLVVGSPRMSYSLMMVDNVICLFFFVDFCWQAAVTRPRRAYLKWGWLDLVSSIPMLPALRVARIARVARIIRVLRGGRASKHLLQFVLIHRARNTFLAVVFGCFVLLLFAVVAMVTVEPTFEPEEAFWWCLFTLITGEYGDFYPGTVEGRVITVVLMTAGVALFGTFTATVASFFVEEEQEEDERRDEDMRQEIVRLAEEVSRLRREMKGDNRNNQTGGGSRLYSEEVRSQE